LGPGLGDWPHYLILGLGCKLTILNIYGPHQDRQTYWNSLAECDWFKAKDFLLGGDLNFSLGASEVWGPRAAPDPLNQFFLNFLDQQGLVDLEPQNYLQPGPTEGLELTE
jgi:hypothetical protein